MIDEVARRQAKKALLEARECSIRLRVLRDDYEALEALYLASKGKTQG